MAKKIISDEALNKLSTYLEKYFSATKRYSSQAVMHLELSSYNGRMGGIEVAKDVSSDLWDYNVLLEMPTYGESIKFVVHGNTFVVEMLAKQFGGKISNCRYWIMYDEPINSYNHGYKEKIADC